MEEIQAPLQNNQQPYTQLDAIQPIADDLRLTKCKKIFQWIFWWVLEGLPTYHEWEEMRSRDGQWVWVWVWVWQFRQVTHPLFHSLTIVLIEYHDGGLPITVRSWNWGRGRVRHSAAREHKSVEYCENDMGYRPKAKGRDHRHVLRKILDAVVTMWGAITDMPGVIWGAVTEMMWGAIRCMLGGTTLSMLGTTGGLESFDV